jgi:hypothetical protein
MCDKTIRSKLANDATGEVAPGVAPGCHPLQRNVRSIRLRKASRGGVLVGTRLAKPTALRDPALPTPSEPSWSQQWTL